VLWRRHANEDVEAPNPFTASSTSFRQNASSQDHPQSETTRPSALMSAITSWRRAPRLENN